MSRTRSDCKIKLCCAAFYQSDIVRAQLGDVLFCTFPGKVRAATEMARVPSPGGRLGLMDVSVNGPLPEDMQGMLSWVTCLAAAGTPEDYVTTLQAAGFADLSAEDRPSVLLDMLADMRRRPLDLELAAGLGQLRSSAHAQEGASGLGLAGLLSDLDLNVGKRLVRRAAALIERGTVGYVLIAARKDGDTANDWTE